MAITRPWMMLTVDRDRPAYSQANPITVEMLFVFLCFG
jgi:hypothetical protein